MGTGGNDIIEDLSDHRRGQPDVDEARSRDLKLVDVTQLQLQPRTNLLGNVTRLPLQRFGQLESNVRGEVTMTRIAGALNENLNIRRSELGDDFFKRLTEPIGPGNQDVSPDLGFSLVFGLLESELVAFAGSFFSDFSELPVSYLV